jgi:UDP-GlcNAc:undecaprenyl-phosphate/decaprenyl-phosphate GlcNAc-1-phosphate transferase
MTALDALLAFAVALAASLIAVPIVARLSIWVGAVDAPDGRRKKQERAIPLGGGLAVGLAAALGVAMTFVFGSPGDSIGLGSWYMAVPSAIVLTVVGLVDDSIGLTGIYKLIGQVLAASLLVSAGFQFESISLAGWSFPLGAFGIPFSMFFCLGAMNAFNLIDGADGLAASIGAVVCLTLGIIAGNQGAVVAGLTSFAFSGALVGFLRYNAPPARVYLGDTGSMLIGWLVAAVAIRSSIKEQAVVALTVPVAICAIPILDAAAALVRRMTTGQSVFTADRGHFHHALMLRGWSAGQTAAMAAGLTGITCAGAIASYFTEHEVFAMAAAGGVIVALAVARVFGHSEVKLLASHGRSMIRGAWGRLRPADSQENTDQAIQLQGRREWHVLWSALREAAVVHRLGSLRLNINIPHLHESFYANWRANDAAQGEGVWRMAIPLLYAGRSVGRLLLEGRAGGNSLVEMQHVMDFLEPLEAEVARLVEEVEAEGNAGRLRASERTVAASLTGGEPLIAAADYY